MNFGSRFTGTAGRQGSGYVPRDMNKMKRIVVTAVLVFIVLVAAATSWYTVDEKQQAVITTFGKVTNVTDAGVHLSCLLVSSRLTRSMSTSISG
jgi:hypothetical protein